MLIGKRTKIFAALTASVKPVSILINALVGHEIVTDVIQNALLGILGAASLYFLADKVQRNGGGK